jgi:hypothetical protein
VIYADSNRLIAEHRRNGHEITATARHDIHAYKLETKTNPKIPFRELFEDYARFRANTDTHNMGLVMKRNPLVVESYDKLGADRVRELKHNQTQIKRELLKLAPTDLAYKITKLIKSDIPQGTAIPAKVAKERLQKIYDDLGMKRTAKATDIAE